ncbi:MAG: type II secretion system protein GspM [Paraglaciecola sp.]
MNQAATKQGLKERYDTLFVQFLKITQREKLLILFSGVVIIILIGYLLFIEPVNESTTRNEQTISSLQNQLNSLQAQIEVAEYALGNDPNDLLVESLDKLTDKSQDLDLYLQQETVNLVPPTQMPLLLENMLAGSQGVTLVSMQSIAPTPVLSSQTKTVDAESDAESNDTVVDEINLYRHGVLLSLRGSYFDIQHYLTRIEGLKWQFYWKRFNYVVTGYPEALVEVELYTLSTSKAFIGV